MERTPTQNGRALVVAIVAVLALGTYACQSARVTNSNTAAIATPGSSPPQIVIPPYPSTFPASVPPATVSGNIPFAVPLPGAGSTPAPPLTFRPNFDYFSWQSFIALNWPATSGSRGVPDQPNNPNVFFNAAPDAPVVWGTYKDSFDLFGQKDKRPNAWDDPDGPITPCANAAGQKALIFMTKGDTPLMQTTQAFSYPLIDQRGNYVHYDIRYDQAEYNFIRGQDGDSTSWLYLLKNLAPKENAQFGVQMPMTATTPANQLGSIMVKAAWRIKSDKDNAGRYYAITAQIYNPQTQACAPATVLLVGLHIAHKVDPFTEWVWSTFEQIDNVPPDSDITPQPLPPAGGYSFNNGTNNPKTEGGYNYKPSTSPAPSPSPVQVTRVNPIPNTPTGASTREFNTYYQQLLKGTIWQFYQLVITQWPSNPGLPANGGSFMLMQNGGVYPLNAGSAFPVNGAVNTTMETYFQAQNDAAGAGGNSCMSCHYRAGQSDFSWGLNRRAHN